MMTLSSCQLKRLEWELYKATVSGICQWQLLMPKCILLTVGEYGIFITRYDHFAWLNIYRGNSGCVMDLKVFNLNILFDKALKRIDTENRMRLRDCLEKNGDISETTRRNAVLEKKVRAILHQP